MKKDKNVKQVSRLTGALLARKGAAATSPLEQQTLNGSLENANLVAKHLMFQQNGAAKKEKQFLKVQETANKGGVSPKKSKSAKSSTKPATAKRIAMTLRMEEENHLKLRIYSAHTRKSCQVILSEALDLYLAKNTDKVPMLKIASQNI